MTQFSSKASRLGLSSAGSSCDDPYADLLRAVHAFRIFARDNPVLTQVMFSRPFAGFGGTRLQECP
jgi:hypothetical protein